MTNNSQKYTAKLFLIPAAALLLTGCVGSAQEKQLRTGCGDSAQEKQLRELKERLEVAAKTKIAENAFINGLGTPRFSMSDRELVSPISVQISCETFSLDKKMLFPFLQANSLADFNAMLKRVIYFYVAEAEEKTEKKNTTGALAAFFYPLFDKLFEADETQLKTSTMWVSLIRIILECKESLVQLVKKPSNYSASKLKKILDDCEQKLQAAPELIIEGEGILKEKPGGTAKDYYQEPGVKEAFEAFKKKVAELQANYEKVTGKGKQEDATKKAASKAS